MNKRVQPWLFVMLFLGLQACGQTGPLYLPGTPPPVYVPEEDRQQ